MPAPTQKSTTKKPSEEASSGLFAQFEVRPPLMLSCSLERQPELEPADDDAQEPKRFYTAIMQRLTTQDDHVLAIVEFSAGETYGVKDSVETFKFSAAYIVGAKISRSLPAADKMLCIEHLTKGGAWARFKDMFSLVVTQTEGELPALPQTPKISWKKIPDKKAQDTKVNPAKK